MNPEQSDQTPLQEKLNEGLTQKQIKQENERVANDSRFRQKNLAVGDHSLDQEVAIQRLQQIAADEEERAAERAKQPKPLNPSEPLIDDLRRDALQKSPNLFKALWGRFFPPKGPKVNL